MLHPTADAGLSRAAGERSLNLLRIDRCFIRLPMQESIVMPASVVSIGASAFSGAIALKSVKLSPALEYISSYAFSRTALTQVPCCQKAHLLLFEGG